MNTNKQRDYFISGVLEQNFSIWKIVVQLDIAGRQLSPASNLQRKHELATDTVGQLATVSVQCTCLCTIK